MGNLTKPEYIESCIRKYGLKDWESICAAVGHGALKEGQIVNRLRMETPLPLVINPMISSPGTGEQHLEK